MSTAQDDWNDQHRNHGLPVPKEAETVGRIAALLGSTPWEKQPAVIAEQIRQAEQDGRADERQKILAEIADKDPTLHPDAIRVDERRKALEEAAQVAKRYGVATLSPSGVVLLNTCAAKIRNLATTSEPGEDT